MSTSRATRDLASIVGARIRLARNTANLTQHQLAVAIGAADLTAISRWERGISQPSPESMFALTAYLQRDLSWFYESEDAAA